MTGISIVMSAMITHPVRNIPIAHTVPVIIHITLTHIPILMSALVARRIRDIPVPRTISQVTGAFPCIRIFRSFKRINRFAIRGIGVTPVIAVSRFFIFPGIRATGLILAPGKNILIFCMRIAARIAILA